MSSSQVQAGPAQTPSRKAQRDNYVFSRIDAGEFADVYSSIEKATANTVLSDFSSGRITQAEALIRLRAALQAIKVTKFTTGSSVYMLDREFAVLQRIAQNQTDKPNLALVYKCDPSPEKKTWYTLELLTGNSFEAYRNILAKFYFATGVVPTSYIPISFCWHLILQMTEAFLVLHFGDRDGVEDESWPLYTHNDIHLANMLFRGGPPVYGNYPGMVLIDFGMATSLTTETDREKFFRRQAFDVVKAITGITDTMYDKNPIFEALYKEISDLDSQDTGDNNELLKSYMRKLRIRALREREDSYVPLDPELVEHFQKELMSDEELWKQTNAKALAEQAGPA